MICDQRSDYRDCADYEVVWPVAKMLATYLCENPDLVKGKKVIELGSGAGLTGIVASFLGASETVLTDLPAALPLLQYNIQINGSNAKAAQLVWGSDKDVKAIGKGDLIIISDLLYNQDEDIIAKLVWTARALSKAGATLLVAYETRDNMLNNIAFFEDMQSVCDCRAVDLEPYADSDLHEMYNDTNMDECVLYIYTAEEAIEPGPCEWGECDLTPSPPSVKSFSGGPVLGSSVPYSIQVVTAGGGCTPLLTWGSGKQNERIFVKSFNGSPSTIDIVVGDNVLAKHNAHLCTLKCGTQEQPLDVSITRDGSKFTLRAGEDEIQIESFPAVEVKGWDKWERLQEQLTIEKRNGFKRFLLRMLPNYPQSQDPLKWLEDEQEEHAIETRQLEFQSELRSIISKDRQQTE